MMSEAKVSGVDWNEINKEKMEKDGRLLDVITGHLDQLGWSYSVKGLCEDKGVIHGEGIKIVINKIGKVVNLFFNHNRNRKISIKDKVDVGDWFLVVSLSEDNCLGYTSRGVVVEDLDRHMSVEKDKKGWKRKVDYEGMGVFNLGRRLSQVGD